MSASMRGLSLIEMLLVVGMISVMMALSLPMLTHANAEARSTVCRENLFEIGTAITDYIHERGELPRLVDLPTHRTGTALPELMTTRAHTPNVLFCPSDETDQSQLAGTSYRWAFAMNGMKVSELSKAIGQPVLRDREPFHQGMTLATNELVVQRDAAFLKFVVTGLEDGPSRSDPLTGAPLGGGNNNIIATPGIQKYAE